MRAAPTLAHEADRVAVVHHHERAVLLRQIADRGQVCDGAIHRKHAVGGDELDPRAVCRLQLLSQAAHVVVLIAITRGFAEAHAVDDARVVEFVGNHRVRIGQERFKQAAVCVEAGAIENRILHAQKTRNPRFQLFVDALRAADEAHGGKPVTPRIIGGSRRRDQGGMIRQPQIVVGAHIEHARRLRGVDSRALRRGDHALFLIRARGANLVQHAAIDFIRLFAHAFSSVQSSTTLPLRPLFITAKASSNSV